MKLNENLYTLRRSKNLSQENLAEKLHVTRQTISNWELGQTSPNPEQLLILSELFEISIDEMVGNELVFKKKDNEEISKGAILICAVIAGIWSFTQNRFTYKEMIFISLAGGLIGYGIHLIISGLKK